MRLVPLAVSAVTFVSIAVGIAARPLGFDPWSSAIAFWIFASPVAAAAALAADRAFPRSDTAEALMRAALIFVASTVAIAMTLGAVGLLQPLAAAGCGVGILGLAVWKIWRAPGDTPVLVPGAALPLLALSAAIVALAAGYGLTHSPLTAYDSLSYHLFFPARWLQEHRLSIIPTPFSDEAQAYAPANGELFFLWLMLPVHGDLLARIGQAPFFVWIGLAIYALARRAGARPLDAMWPAVFCFVSRPMIEQAGGADVDLICWSLFLTALDLGLSALESGSRRDWLLWGISLGLYAGTKYVALVYAPVFLLFPVVWLWRRSRGGGTADGLRRLAWILPGLAAFGLPWYLRNWIEAGSPLYPASLGVAGVTIAQGAYSRAAMLHSVFHTTDVRLLPVMLAHAIGTTLGVFWAPCVVVGAWGMARSSKRWPARMLLLLPVAMIGLYWFGVPDNVDSRFMLPVGMLGLIPLAFAFRASPGARGRTAWNGAVHAVYAAGVIWALIGAPAEIPARLPWFMGGWLSLRGLTSPMALSLVLVMALAMWLLLRVSPASLRVMILAAVVALPAGVLAAGQSVWCAPPDCEYLQTTSIFLRPTFVEAWHWTDRQLKDATVAYAGNNVPYPLAGPHLTNRVIYANIDRHPAWRFDDYDRAARQRLHAAGAAALAVSSGVLLPIDASGGRVDAVRPRYERMRGDRDAWVANLWSSGATHLFVSALSAYEIDYMFHNAGGFPIEDDWARQDPRAFRLVYDNPQVRIYALDLRRRTE